MDQTVPTAVIGGIHTEMETLPNITYSYHTACVFQSLTRTIFYDLVGKCIKSNSVDTSVGADDYALTIEEENAVRYVGGYIVRALKAKTKDKQKLLCLQQLEATDQSQAEDQASAQWVIEINQGGLIHLTNATHDCFVSIEAATRRHYKVSKAHTMDESMKKHVVNQVVADNHVQFHWCLLGITIDFGEELSEEILESCVHQWVTVRQYSFAKNVMELYKQETKNAPVNQKLYIKHYVQHNSTILLKMIHCKNFQVLKAMAATNDNSSN